MKYNDDAVFTAGQGYIYEAPTGTALPTRSQITNFNPDVFGSHTHRVVISGDPSSGSFTLTVAGTESGAIPFDAGPSNIQAALEATSTVGVGNVLVTEAGKGEFLVGFVGEKFGTELTLTATASFDKGDVVAAEDAKPLPWEPVGHTSLEDLPEFGYDGGDTEVKGTWQKKKLREVVTEQLVDYVIYKIVQFDEKTLENYFGKNATSSPGMFAYTGKNAVKEGAILIVVTDGDRAFAVGAAKASSRRDDSIEMSTEDFAAMPVRSTFLDHPGRPLLEWVFPNVVNP